MNAVYLIVNEDRFLQDREISKIIKNKKDIDVIRYDMKEISLEQALEDLNTMNFFTQEKVVIADNCYFLTSEKPRGVIEQDVTLLEKYVKNPNSENILILTCSKLDERKSIVKLLKKEAKLIEGQIDIYQLIKENLEDYLMNREAEQKLVERTLNNPERILQELDKLKLYKYDTKEILLEDVDSLVTKTIDDNIFTLIDAIIKRNKQQAFEIYEDMILHNEEPTKILILLANRIRLLYQVKVLSKTIYRDDEIGRIIGSHPYPVKLAREMIHKFKEKDLLRYLDELAHIDLAIKTGKTYQNIALEQFILTL